jgi:hypothetical protein
MKIFVLIFINFFIIFLLHGQDYNLENGIVLNGQNRNLGLVVNFSDVSDIRSAWDRGTVRRYSHNENNITNLGRFIEIEYELGFVFRDTFIGQGQMIVVFSNLTEFFLNEEMEISIGTIIGRTNEIRMFILSETDNIPILSLWTNNKKRKIGDYWYWDTSFLLR